jgi:hypothetical protein
MAHLQKFGPVAPPNEVGSDIGLPDPASTRLQRCNRNA